MYPWVEPRDLTPWVVYFAALVLWVLAFSSAEIYFRFRVRRQDQGYSKVPYADSLKAANMNALDKYTWDTLDKAILNGYHRHGGGVFTL